MPTKELIQVVSYIKPSLKKLAEKRITESEVRMSMSGYISMLMSKDLQSKRSA